MGAINIDDILTSYVKQRRVTLSFTEISQFAIWVNHLLELPIGQACLQLWQTLHELRELECQDSMRLHLLEQIEFAVSYLSDDLYKIVIKKYDIQSRHQQIISIVMALHATLLLNYYEIASRIDEQLEQKLQGIQYLFQRFNLKTILLKSCYYGLKSASQLNYYQMLFDQKALEHQWILTHKLYHLSYKNKQHKVYLHDFVSQNSDYDAAYTIIQQYKQILLFDLLTSSYLNHQDINHILYYSYQWADYLKFIKQGTKKYQLNFQMDLPMQCNAQHADLQVDNRLLLEYFNQSKTLEEFNDNPTLQLHIHYILTQGYKRQDRRYDYSAQIEVYIDYMHMLNILNQQQSVERHQISGHTIQILDKSRHGYRLQWKDSIPIVVKKGNLILIREKHSEQKMISMWQIASIRWVKEIEKQHIELGIEVLSSNQMMVMLGQESKPFIPAIMCYSTHAWHRKSYFLILPKHSQFKLGDYLEMSIQDFTIPIFLNRLLNQESQYLVGYDIKLKKMQDSDILYNILTKQVS